MFVFSVKSTKLKFALLVIVIVIAAVSLLLLSDRGSSASADSAVNYSAANAEERIVFLSQFGWEVTEDPVEVAEVIIPSAFDEVYSEYNKIQTGQELDLEPYANIRVKRWTYVVKNYPGYDGKDCIRANILVYDGRVIGGDICSTELDGFMHGFKLMQS